jgi:lipopolysaccharide export LptBFGC system permease protein LptF
VIAAGIFASLTLFAMSEFLLPFTNRVAERDYNVIKGRPPQTLGYLERRWILGSDSRIYNYDYLAQGEGPDDIALYSLNVFDVDQKTWELRDRLFAARAVWKDAAYELERGWRRTFGARGGFRTFHQSRTREIEAPSYFKQEERDSDALGFAALRAHIASLESLGLDVAKLRVQLHKKLAFPVVCLVMTLIGIPFSFVVARGGALFGVGLSLLIAIVFWVCIAVFDALGNNALLPAALAAWSPNLLFGAAGFYLMLTLET